MTFEISKRRNAARAASASSPAAPWTTSESAAMRTVELIFFVHLRMADCADPVLAEIGLGRPHHRLLYFVARNPGITVGDLTALLHISNQALSRTTNQLTSMGLLEQRYSLEDRRVRQNFVTTEGLALLRRLIENQMAMISRAHAEMTPEELSNMWRSLAVMIHPQDMVWVQGHPGEKATIASTTKQGAKS